MSSDSLQIRSTPASVKLTLAKLLGQDRELCRYLVTGCKEYLINTILRVKRLTSGLKYIRLSAAG